MCASGVSYYISSSCFYNFFILFSAPLNADINVGFQGDCSTKYHPCMEVPFGTVLGKIWQDWMTMTFWIFLIVGDSIKRSFGSDSSVEISFGKLLKLLNMFRKIIDYKRTKASLIFSCFILRQCASIRPTLGQILIDVKTSWKQSRFKILQTVYVFFKNLLFQ